MKELKIWLLYTTYSFEQALAGRAVIWIFILGKILRIGLFIAFLNFLFAGSKSLAGYRREQIIFFYLAFNFIDSLGQMLFREVYRFGNLVVSGGLDQVLAKPINPLIRVLLGGADILDLIMLVPILLITVWFGVTNITTSFGSWLLFAILCINGLFISAALHIFVLGLIVRLTTVNNLIMIYRDLAAMIRVPVDVYSQPLKFLLTFAIPLGIMLTFPAKALMDILPLPLIFASISLSLLSIFLSLRFWHSSLRHYQSASS